MQINDVSRAGDACCVTLWERTAGPHWSARGFRSQTPTASEQVLTVNRSSRRGNNQRP